MTPNINYGQVVRGVGAEHQKGTFTGVLDMRGMIKVVNAILALKVSKSPDWTLQRDQAMKTWMARYVNWLETSEIAQKTAKSAKYVIHNYLPTNHLILLCQQPCYVLLLSVGCCQDLGWRYFWCS